MKPLNLTLISLALIFLYSISFASALIVNADYVTIYPGEQGKVSLKIENNENFDIESISVGLNLNNLPFSAVGSSEKDVDDIDEDDDDSASFTLKASTDIKPGDYNIPYVIKYTNSKTDEKLEKQGSFGIRVSSKTELDFGIEKTNEVVGKQGKVTLEIINKGLGEIKAVSVEIVSEGFELISKDKIFIGTINGDDTDTASFDVIYKSTSPVLKAKIEYKDFDNKDQVENINIPFKIYTEKEALELGIIKKSNSMIYMGIIVVLMIIWITWRKIKKRRKNNRNKERI